MAIKVESIHSETKLLKNESIIYQYLNSTPGVPSIKWFGKDNINYYMVMNLLGDSLLSIKNKQSCFSLKLVLQIGINIIKLLNTIQDLKAVILLVLHHIHKFLIFSSSINQRNFHSLMVVD